MTTALFWIYAAALFLGVRTLSHELLSGWPAKLATMGGMAVGLLPWAHWLGPRIAWTLGWIGRAVMVACYVVVLMPIALVVKLITGTRRAGGATQWVDRPQLPDTVEAARLEY